MPQAISRQSFMRDLSEGVELANRELQTQLQAAGVEQQTLGRLDRNGDGVLRGGELRRAFRLVDSFDRNGTRHSFRDAGQAGDLYAALMAGRREAPDTGSQIAGAALSRALVHGPDYAYDAAPTSPNPRISHNHRPGQTRLNWLRQQNKCNQFVGDALVDSGFEMPTYRMRNGSAHYMNAEALPRQQQYFARLSSSDDLQIGDVVVVDYPGRGSNTAHTEIVTGRDATIGSLHTTGAHRDGAYERDWSNLLDNATYSRRQRAWVRDDGTAIYLLRPQRRAR